MKALRLSKGVNLFSGLVLTIILLVSSTYATKTFEPVFKPTLSLVKSGGEISIDGRLNDIGWKNAVVAEGFVERNPGDKTMPAVETRALITYDDDHLYVAFLCYDDPRDIRATMCDRDQFSSDDAVCVLIDTYDNASWAYELFVNPYGVQKDNLWSSVAGEDAGFDLIWHSAAQITDSGYQVEIAVPFASMRFPNKSVQSWRVDFWRNRPRENFNQYSWAAYDRNENCWPCQWGVIDGISNVQPGKGLEILPTYIATQSGQKTNVYRSDSEFDNAATRGEFSIGSKYSISSNVTLEASYNPDFSQIEGDAAQIDVNTTIALFYPERRPFFQEGADIFRTLFNSFYTRTVNDPIFAAKMIGRFDKTTFGIFSAQDENTPYMIPLYERSLLVNSGKSTVNAVRAIHTLASNSQIGFLITDRRFDKDGYGTILAFDHDIRLTRSMSVDGQYILTETQEPNMPDLTSPYYSDSKFDNDKYTVALDEESYAGHAFISRLKYFARTWHFMLNYNQVSPSYRTETGYDPLVNYRDASYWTEYVFYPENSIVDRINPQVYVSKRWDFDGGLIRENLNFALGNRLTFAQTYIELFYGTGSEYFGGYVYDRLWDAHIELNSRPLAQLGISLNLSKNRNIARNDGTKGNEFSARTSLTIKPLDRLVIEPTFTYARSTNYITGEELYKGYITRARLRYQVSKEIALRLVAQYNDFSERMDFDPLLTYRISPFSVFYVGSTYDYWNIREYDDSDNMINDSWDLTSRQFFVKLQYLFRT